MESKNQRRLPINLAEWHSVIADDASLFPIDHIEGKNPMTGEDMFVPTPNSAEWREHPSGRRIRFSHSHGEIRVNLLLDEHVLQKAKEIATKLSAQIHITDED